ncbi:MAG: hypothetical protein WKH64_02680 [Chloroflexia bacterium]
MIACEPETLEPGCWALIFVEAGRFVGRVAVAPQHVVRAGRLEPGWRLKRAASDEEAHASPPASDLLASEGDGRRPARSERTTLRRRAPDRHDSSRRGGRCGGRAFAELGVPVQVRNEHGRITDPPLPDLRSEMVFEGESVRVVGLSVFQGWALLEADDGETRQVPLADVLASAAKRS